MSYQALYRVWRSQTFDELVGQNMIATTLKNAIKNEQLSHAYLFTGPRGTGKTSAAKILAKAVNCPNQTDGNPCNECELCKGITNGQISDVIEIDAASNNGVEEIRDLRDKVRYAPTQASYKVYIIDEVHMLTTGAFNALLKTLEEPPAQVLFILATTEPHKIPATIISRTQRFDFQRLKEPDIIGHMSHILKHYEVSFEEEALAIIARASNGGMRDSLSLLDQALSFNNEAVTVETALEVSGSFDQQTYVEYIMALQREEAVEALDVLGRELSKGKQASRFIEELILFSRDVLLTLHSPTNKTMLTDAEFEPLRQTVPAVFYYRLINALNNAQNQMRFSNQPDLYLEVMTVQLCEGEELAAGQAETGALVQSNHPSAKPAGTKVKSIEELKQRIGELEEQMSQLYQQLSGHQKQIDRIGEQTPQSGQVAVAPINEVDQSEATDQQPEQPLVPRERPKRKEFTYRLNLSRVYKVLNDATRQHIQALKQAWPLILSELTPQDRAKFMGTMPIAAGPNLGLISFESEQFCGLVQNDSNMNQRITNIATEKLNETVKLTFVLAKEWPDIRQNYKILRDKNNGEPVILEDDEMDRSDASDDIDTTKPEFVKSEPENEATASSPSPQASTQSVQQASQTTAEYDEIEASQHIQASPASSDDTHVPSFAEVVEQERQVEQPETSPDHPVQDREAEHFEDVSQPEEPEEPAAIKKAFELFGDAHVNVFHDR